MNRLERQKERDREKVKLICIDCNKEFNLSYGRYRRIKNNQYRCKECMNINRANKNRENYKNLSQEEKNRVNNKRTSYWKDDNNKKKKSENMKQFYQNLNENDKKNWTKGIDGYYRNLSDKEKELHSQRTKDQWSNYTKEEYDKRCENISIGKNNWWNNLSQEERNEWNKTSSKKTKQWWNSLTEEELIIQGMKISQAYHDKSQEEFEKMTFDRLMKLNKIVLGNHLELEFKNILHLEKINYEFQYLNQIEHPDFKKLFPINPVTNGKVFPLHTWDFKLVFNNISILVDIDGSIHNMDNKPYDELNDFNKEIYFDDSQRIYQTDDLDAYIIRAYKDNLYDKEVTVEKLQTKEIMNLNQFISIISYMNNKK